ncbi:MAG: hypothetical protein IPJ32_19165 [Sphingobacteriaceae bacterium]|nr:hypothetical protein [Sphingobacteriaceae bacterium]
MPKLYIITFLLFSIGLNAQIETIKIKKEKESSILTSVTLAGVKDGEVSLTKLCSDNKFTILNNPGKYKVYFAIIKFTDGDGVVTEWVNSTETLNKQFINYLLSPRSATKTKVTITEIKARDNKEQELNLNNITLTIIK